MATLPVTQPVTIDMQCTECGARQITAVPIIISWDNVRVENKQMCMDVFTDTSKVVKELENWHCRNCGSTKGEQYKDSERIE